MPARWNLAARLDSYRRDLRSALETARVQHYQVVQADTVDSELAPRAFGESARRHLARHLINLGLRLDCLTVDFPGSGLSDPNQAEPRLRHVTETLKLCRDLGVPRAAVRFGIPARLDSDPHALRMLIELADRADRYEVDVAVDPAGASLGDSAAGLASLRCPRLGVALDSAALAGSEDAPRWPQAAPFVVQLRDARRAGNTLEETEFGAGEVPFSRLLEALRAGGYSGSLAVRRDAARDAVDAMRRGGEYVRLLMERSQA